MDNFNSTPSPSAASSDSSQNNNQNDPSGINNDSASPSQNIYGGSVTSSVNDGLNNASSMYTQNSSDTDNSGPNSQTSTPSNSNDTSSVSSYSTPSPSADVSTSSGYSSDHQTSLQTLNTPSVPFKDKLMDTGPAALLFLCLLFVVIVQNFAQSCRRYCQTDSSCTNSIVCGVSLGYLFSKVMPYLMNLVSGAHQIEDIYFRKADHLLLVTFFAFGLGLLINYFFEKKLARNIVEDVPHSAALYCVNMAVILLVSFFVGFHLLTFNHFGLFEGIEYALILSALLFMEVATLCNLFGERSFFFRRIALSTAIVVGFAFSKFALLSFTPLISILSLSFTVGFFVFSTMRVEMALIKRNSNYIAFIISFIGLCALTIIQSLYESVRC